MKNCHDIKKLSTKAKIAVVCEKMTTYHEYEELKITENHPEIIILTVSFINILFCLVYFA